MSTPGGRHDLVGRISRDVGGWYAYVPELEGAVASARSLDAVTDQVQRRAATLLVLALEDTAIRWEYDLPATTRMAIDEVQAYQAELAEAQMNYNQALRRAVLHLRDMSYSDRDAAFL